MSSGTDHDPEIDPYAISSKDAKRANLILNVLVVISAMAGSAFLLYVAHTVFPAFRSSTPVEDVHTSRTRPMLSFLTGSAGDLTVLVRDLDDAEGYNRDVSSRIAGDLGIARSGLIYRIVIQNSGETEQRVRIAEVSIQGDDGQRWQGAWLDAVADREAATPTGSLRLGQQSRDFVLPAGAQRQLEFFVEGQAPAMSNTRSGRLKFGDGSVIELRRQDVRTGEDS